MPCFRYRILAPIRLLIPLAAGAFALPFILTRDLMLYVTVPIFYFTGSYFILLNFPSIAERLHQRPLYLEDLEIVSVTQDNNQTFQIIYSIVMNFLLAVLFAGLTEYMLLQNVASKPIVEVAAILGGTLGLYYKVQGMTGKLLIFICHRYKTYELNRLQACVASSQTTTVTGLGNPLEPAIEIVVL